MCTLCDLTSTPDLGSLNFTTLSNLGSLNKDEIRSLFAQLLEKPCTVAETQYSSFFYDKGTSTASGTAYDDIMTASGPGLKTFSGGLGNDTYVMTTGNASMKVVEDENGGFDTIVRRGADHVIIDENVEAIVVRGSANTLKGNASDNVIMVTVASGLIEGMDGDDIIRAPIGTTLIDGGNGTDTAVFASHSKFFAFSRGDDGNVIVTETESGLKTALKDVEFISFNDRKFSVEEALSNTKYLLPKVDRATVLEDNNVVIDVLKNDISKNFLALKIVSVDSPAHGIVYINQNGTITYKPDTNFNGSDSFVYTLQDSEGRLAKARVDVEVAAVNDAPAAQNDTASTLKDKSVVINLLTNDSDVDGDTLSVASLGVAANGSLVLNPDGTVTYTPKAGFVGTDTFTYSISDGKGGAATATATVTVQPPPNRGPEALNDAASTIKEQPVIVNLLNNDTDPDGDSLTITGLGVAANGSATLNDDGTVTYTPKTGFIGTDTFTYTISDGKGGTATASAIVTVLPPPNKTPDAVNDTASTLQDKSVVINLLANDTDPDGDVLTIASIGSAANGSVVLGLSGSVTYIPRAGFSGSDSFTYTVSDGKGGTDTATVSIAVAAPDIPPNRAPDAVDDSTYLFKNSTIMINALHNDTDPDGDALTITSVSSSIGAIVTVQNNNVYYEAKTNFRGVDILTYTISDGKGGTDTAKITLNVIGNDIPIANADNAVTAKNTSVKIDVLLNDTDGDSDKLTITNLGAPGNGTVVLNADGTVTYTPKVGYTGNDTFTYQISDGYGGTASATVSVLVGGGVNSAPIAQNDSVTILKNQSLILRVLENDSDIDGDGLTILNITNASHGTATLKADGTIQYYSTYGYTGQDSFNYTVSDGRGGTKTATVNITIDPISATPYYVQALDSGKYFAKGTQQITFMFPDQLPWYMGTPSAGSTGANASGFTDLQKQAAREILKNIGSFINIEFVEVTSNAEIVFMNENRGQISTLAEAYYPGGYGSFGGTFARASDVFMNIAWAQALDTRPGTRGYQALAHEIGHALGMDHTHEGIQMPWAENNTNYTVMSYERPEPIPQTMMMYDIATLQTFYGANMHYNTGDDVYAIKWGQRYAIWDAGGNDTLDGSMQTGAMTLNLKDGSFSQAGATDNVSIAIGATIENAFGGSGNDTLLGNAVGNTLKGNGGDDILKGFEGNDVLVGGLGTDTLYGGLGNDVLHYDGQDVLFGDEGIDTMMALLSTTIESSSALLKSLERFDLADAYSQVVNVRMSDILTLSDNDDLYIMGDAKDTVNVTGGSKIGQVTLEGVLFNHFSDGLADLFLAAEINVNKVA